MSITADELYEFICANAEEIDGEIMCGASLWEELARRGVPLGPVRRRLRTQLVKELEDKGLIKRVHPRSRFLVILKPPRSVRQKLRVESRRRFEERMALDAIEVTSVPKHGFDHNARATRGRIAQLQDYFRSNVMVDKRFICANWRDCETSIASGCTFKEGQLSHVGKHYDLSRDGRPLRIVVVGQEVAGQGKPRITMGERYARVHDHSGLTLRFDSDRGHKRRNPHMRGTTLALRTIFGLKGTDHATEFLHLDGENVHMFDCFALVNRLLCAAHLAGTSTGKSTKTMLNNCERHFRATLEILDPTLIVIQGAKVWRWSQNVLVPIKKRTDNFFECELGDRRVTVAAFTHPAAWGPAGWASPTSPYFKDVVRPTLRRAAKLSS